MIVSPYGVKNTTTVTNCGFSNVYNAYALKDVYSSNATIQDCTFKYSGGGMYFEGSEEKKTFQIIGNTFENMDVNAVENKQGTRGLIQFSANGDYSNAVIDIRKNTSIGDAAVIRQLNSTITAAILDEDTVKENNTFAGEIFLDGTGVTEFKTIYLDTEKGNDKNNGLEETPVKTFAKAMELANAGDTVELLSSIDKIDGINKPITIKGHGDKKVPVTGHVTLPGVNGTITLINLSFDGKSTIGLYEQQDYENLNLVIEQCAFTKAGANCVYIEPKINGLTIQECEFVAPATEEYQKQYLIWSKAAKQIVIKDNTFDGKGVTRGAIHLGDGHPAGTSAEISGNTILGFERGVQVAFTNEGVQNAVNINGNTFCDIVLSHAANADKTAGVGTVFIHENQIDNTGIKYDNNALTGTTQNAFYSENTTVGREVIESFTGNKLDGTIIDDVSDSWAGVPLPEPPVEEPPYTGKYSYEIIVKDVENGTLTVDKYATEDETVTVAAIPNDGYQLESLQASAGNEEVAMNDQGNGIYSFVMPSHDVVLTATFVEAQPVNLPFTDVVEDDWYYEAVQYVYANGLMNGVDDTLFSPNNNLSRAMMAAVLYNIEGGGAVSESVFNDVSDGAWYADAVNWAAANDIVGGYEDGTFRPNAPITREQMASIFYRYAAYKGYDISARADLDTYTDGDNVSVWAKEVMQWAVGAELIHGMSDNILLPQGKVTRAQAATVLMNYCGSIEKQ